MRYVKMLKLFFQHVSEQRARTLVWFILSIFSPVIMILFWKGAQITATNWNFSTITSYYLLLVVVGSFLMSHIEDDVARLDIQEGGLASYLLKPFSYFWTKFYTEIPWRVMQALFGVISLLFILLFFHVNISISLSPLTLVLAIVISVFAYFMSFIYKMILGMLAFWFTDIAGIYQLSEMLIFLFAGYIVPIRLYPDVFANMAYFLPFAYIIYFPIIVLQGSLSFFEISKIILIQFVWLVLLYVLYLILWRKGVKAFTGVGQ